MGSLYNYLLKTCKFGSINEIDTDKGDECTLACYEFYYAMLSAA